MRRSRYAKIVATVGPAIASPDKIRALYFSGADAFRLTSVMDVMMTMRSYML